MNLAPKKMSEKMVEACPSCGMKGTLQANDVLQEDQSFFLSYLICSHCDARLLAKVSFVGTALIGNAVITDLSKEEILSLKKQNTILSSDEVLDLVQAVNKTQDLKSFSH